MAMVFGSVFYDETRLFELPKPISNVPIALYNPYTANGAIALTDESGSFNFFNVPNGDYFLIECWGTIGTTSHINYSISKSYMTMPLEADPPITIIKNHISNANKLNSMTPNLYKISVFSNDIKKDFYDGPLEERPLKFISSSLKNNNLLTSVDQGTFGLYSIGTEPSTVTISYTFPGILKGLSYSNIYPPASSSLSTINTTGIHHRNLWNISDHTKGIEIGRQLIINCKNPNTLFFSDTINVIPNKIYAITMWICNLINPNICNILSHPIIEIKISSPNNTVIYKKILNEISHGIIPQWTQIGAVFNSDIYSELKIEILNASSNVNECNYSIDDLELKEIIINEPIKLEQKVDKAASPSNSTLIYTSRIKNISKSTLSDLSFQDILPNEIIFNLGSIEVNDSIMEFENDDPNKGFNLPNLPAGEIMTIIFTANINSGIPNDSIISNRFKVTYPFLKSSSEDIFSNSIYSNNSTTIINNELSPIIINESVNKHVATNNENLTYTININNTSTDTLDDLFFKNILQDEVKFNYGSIKVNNSNIDFENYYPNTGFYLKNLHGGCDTTIEFSVDVKDNVTNDTIVSNYSIVSDSKNSNTKLIASNKAITKITDKSSSIDLIKTVNNITANINDILFYTIIISNSLTTSINNVFFRDILPNEVSFTTGSVTVNGSSIGFESANPNIGFALDNIPSGNTTVVEFNIKILSAPAGNIVTNVATLTGSILQGDGSTSSVNINSNQVTINIFNTIDNISVNMTADKDQVNHGDILTYFISIVNPNVEGLTDVFLQDILPPEAQFNPGSIMVNGSNITNNFADPTIGFYVDNIPGGATLSVSFSTTIVNNSDTCLTITNSANVTGKFLTTSGEYTENATSNDITTIVGGIAPRINVRKQVDKTEAVPGDTLNYSISIINSTRFIVQNVFFIDFPLLADQVSFNIGSIKVNGSGVGFEQANPRVGFPLPNIPPRSITIVEFSVTILSTISVGANIPNRANVQGIIIFGRCRFPQNVNSNTVNTVIISPPPPITVIKAVDRTSANLGDILTYTISINNPSSIILTNVQFIDNLTTGATFNPGSVTVDGSGTGFETANPLIGFPLPNISAGETTIVTFTVTVTSIPIGNIIRNNSTVTGNLGIYPQRVTSNTVQTTIIVPPPPPPPVTINKIVNKPSATIGEILTYTITIHNPSSVVYTNVTFTDNITAGVVSFNVGSIRVNGSGAGFEAANPFTGFSIPNILGGGTTIILFTVTILNVPAGTIISNSSRTKGFLTISFPQDVTSNIVETKILAPPPITVVKAVDKTTANIGDILNYTITINNPSTLTLNNVFFKDTLQGNVQFIVGSIRVNGSGTGFEAANPFTGFTIPNILAGNTTTVTFAVTVLQAPDRSVIRNNSTVTGTLGTLFPQDVTSNTVETIVLNPAPPQTITVRKSVDKTIAQLNDILTYTIVVGNPTPYPLNDVFFKDNLEGGAQFNIGSIRVNGSGAGFEDANPFTGFTIPNIPAGNTTTVVFTVTVVDITTTTFIKNTATITGNLILPGGIIIPQDVTSNSVITTFNQQPFIDIIESIALVETALSHILNAEGEKIQRFLNIPDVTTDTLLKVNNSVKGTVNAISRLETILYGKLDLIKCNICDDTND